jgi:CRP/FNR family transcriptional regulator, cyclic AMP receptor protein
VSVRANTPVWLLTLDHPAHERLRREHLKAAEELALAAVRVLAERFDMLDKRISDYMAQHPDGHSRATEWSNFRARLFEDSTI